MEKNSNIVKVAVIATVGVLVGLVAFVIARIAGEDDFDKDYYG